MHDELDPLIDAALVSVPLSPTPAGFRRRVMNQVVQLQAERLNVKRPEFRLDFLDLALPAFFAFLASLGFAALLGMLSLLDPLRLESLQLGLKSTLWRLPVLEIGGVLIAAGAGVILLLLLALVGAAFVMNSSKFEKIAR